MTDLPMNLGPLDALLADPAITAIFIDGQGVRYSKNGLTQASDIAFENDAQRWQVIESIVSACGETLSTDRPTVDCTLTDGTRVHAEYAPLSLSLDKRGSEQAV
jgi:pilus assembly protein CpaF